MKFIANYQCSLFIYDKIGGRILAGRRGGVYSAMP